MTDTTFFVQCENCEYCTEAVLGYCCDKHSIHIDNPKKDGCTWGAEFDKNETPAEIDFDYEAED